MLTIFSFLKDWSLTALGSLLMLVLSWVAGKYLPKLLDTERKKRMAEYLLKIADDLTDYFIQKYPDSKYAQWIDQAIEKLMEICGVERDVAERVLKAVIERKKIP